MKTVFYIILGLLISTFMSGNLLSPVISYKADSVYAMGPNPGKTDPNRFRNHQPGPDQPASSVPEPSTLASLGAGAAGIGIYLYSRRNKKK